jgi:thioredoxin 1
MSAVRETTDASFKSDVLESEVPVLLDFWAPWCGPCKAIAPILEEVATEYEGKVVISKLNVEENPEVTAQYGVMGIPTLLLFKDGNVEGTKVGPLNKSQMIAFIEGSL